jgi:hypothetical protein
VAEGDDGASEVEECEVVLGFLLPSDEQSAVAVEPGEGAFHDPAVCVLGGLVGESGGFVVACFDDRGEVEGVADVDGGALAVSAVKADHPTCWGWGVGFELLRVKCLAEEQEVGGVGGADHDGGGDTAAVYQEAAFGAVFGSVGGLGPVSVCSKAPSPSRCPARLATTRSRAPGRRRAVPGARAARTRLLASIPGSGGARWMMNRSRWR